MQFIVPVQSRAANIPTVYAVPSSAKLADDTHAGYKAEKLSKPRWCIYRHLDADLSWAIEIANNLTEERHFLPAYRTGFPCRQ